jgi:uncharacterized protein
VTARRSAPPVDAFGDGGFRIGGVRREGSLLIVDGSIRPWAAAGPQGLSPDDFAPFLTGPVRPDLVLLGLGARPIHPPAEVRRAFREANVGLEALDTPAACRSWNLLAGEGRRVGAALIAV